MRDKIVVDLTALLAIANDEYARLWGRRPASSIVHISKGAGTFVLALSGDASAGGDAAAGAAFAQSLYDRYLLKI